MSSDTIIPCIWFHTNDGKISDLIAYYKTIFAANFESGNVIPLGENPSGYSEMCEVKIFGQTYSLMTTQQEHHALNDSISFMIRCDGQEEIDTYWNYFTKDGEESQCGWCIDKYGLRWQITPKNFGELMSRPNAWQVMMGQKKIVIAEY